MLPKTPPTPLPPRPSAERCTDPVPVVGGHHEVEQQPDGLLHVDLVGGGQPLVELVVDRRQDGLQPRHVDLCVVVQRVEPVVTKGFDHVPDIHQMNCKGREKTVSGGLPFLLGAWNRGENLRVLTVASLLHKPELAGRPVGRQSDYVEVLSSCRRKRASQINVAKSDQFNHLKSTPVHTIAGLVWEQSCCWCGRPHISRATCSRSKDYMSWLWNKTPPVFLLSVDSTHSFPWRAVSSPPWPCPVCCLPRSSCGTSDSRACSAYRSHFLITRLRIIASDLI